MTRWHALAALTAALALTTSRSHALESFSPVTYKEARALGLAFRAQKAGPDAVWVEASFEAKGKLAAIKRVTLRAHEGNKLLLFTTLSNEAEPGRVKVSFAVGRDLLGKAELWVSSSLGGGDAGGGSYVLKVSDIDEVKAVR